MTDEPKWPPTDKNVLPESALASNYPQRPMPENLKIYSQNVHKNWTFTFSILSNEQYDIFLIQEPPRNPKI
jgi:hypothetical protein